MGIDQRALDDVWLELDAVELRPFVAELDARGYTVIPPSMACPDGLRDRLLDAVLDVAERRNGTRPDLVTGATHAGYAAGIGKLAFADADDSPIGDLLQSLLVEDRVFEEALMNPVVVAMATYMCGYGVVLSSLGSMLKGPGQSALPLHCDSPLPSPLTSYSVVANCTYALTDYTRENGALAVVPGSHRWGRRPTAKESVVGEHGEHVAIPVECEAGSLICWHGNTWHGAFPRAAPGIRVNLIAYFARSFMRSQEDLVGVVTDEMLERNPPRFAILTQQAVSYGYTSASDAVQRGERALSHLAANPRASGNELY